MIELLLLTHIIEVNGLKEYTNCKAYGNTYNVEMMMKRLDELIEEFLAPYVIDPSSKE